MRIDGVDYIDGEDDDGSYNDDIDYDGDDGGKYIDSWRSS